ncbi:MAG TPA: DUF5631 domain-containing protein [Mycobacterium sp.]|nr:DUF5631 domain-containing protein [Mycobacterium sp.]
MPGSSPLTALSPAAGGSHAPAFQPLTPEKLADTFTNGIQSGSPTTAAAAQAISHNAVANAFQPTHQELAAPVVGPSHSAATTPTAGGYITETAQASSTPTPAVAVPPPAAVTAPVASAAPVASGGPAGPLPAYGADIRPATPTFTGTAAPLASAPAATSPTSAAASPSAGGTLGQSTVVQKTASQSAHTPQPVTGLTENAVAATAAGAMAGALSAQNIAQKRLRTVVEFVARQQPKLRWAAGERADGTILLVTDLAFGWIPPGIEIPAGVSILEPAQRRNSLEALLGAVDVAQTWVPGQQLPSADDAPAVSTSIRARDLPAVDDLNWELTQVTNWRDGLPRLAHTLSKAAIAGTGVLESEVELLHEHLQTTSEAALTHYPDAVDDAAVGNWQLLAAIAALINGEKTALNYHFSWFKTLNTAGAQ